MTTIQNLNSGQKELLNNEIQNIRHGNCVHNREEKNLNHLDILEEALQIFKESTISEIIALYDKYEYDFVDCSGNDYLDFDYFTNCRTYAANLILTENKKGLLKNYIKGTKNYLNTQSEIAKAKEQFANRENN